MTDLRPIVRLLQREYLFNGLTDEQLVLVASRFKRVTFEKNTIVFAEGAPADCFYIVENGKVRVTRRAQGKDKFVNTLNRGDFFGEQALLFDTPRSATVTTIEPTQLLRLDPVEFSRLLADFPDIRMNLSSTAESRQLARRLSFDWLGEDEVIYLVTRKSSFFLFVSLIVPILLGILALPLLAFSFTLASDTPIFVGVLAGSLLLLIAALAWGLWKWIDWGNDFYIVTSQRVVWLEKIVALYNSRREAPLDSVLAVNVTSSQLGRILHYGNVNVRTFTGGILMRNMDDPGQFAAFVEGYRKRVKVMDKEEEEQAMEDALAQALNDEQALLAPPDEKALVVAPAPTAPNKPSKPQPPSLREQFSNFLKVRYEKNGTITYRKHWLVLLGKAWLPVLIGLSVIAGEFFAVYLNLTKQLSQDFLFLFSGIAFLAFVIICGWAGYHYLDWSNDIYRITPDQILDIERKPLGQEVKKTANLDSIMSIEHRRNGLFGIFFNFGTVGINIGQTTFDFFDVYNPDQVHADIADFREALLRRKRNEETKRERDRMVNWLVAFYKQNEKLDQIQNQGEEDEFLG